MKTKLIAGVFAFAVAIMFLGIASGTMTVSEDNITANQGDEITVTVKSSDVIDTELISERIQKVDGAYSFYVYWETSEKLSVDLLTMTVTIVIPEDADSGTYTITIMTSNQQMVDYVTLYIPSESGINIWLFLSFEFFGLLMVGILAIGYHRVKETKTLGDDIAIMFVGIAGLILIAVGLLYFFGYIML